MNNRRIALVLVLILISALILYLESGRPKYDTENDINLGREKLKEDDLRRIELKSKTYPRAKELVQPEGYINTGNITIAEHVGKDVILVDFWTYSCINCQRTFPYLNKWFEEYSDKGLVIIGVHTPEFEFEKDYDNVLMATEKWGIKYPVVQDNDYRTWRAYNNRYWPRKYLIDIDGFIVYDHIGEGAYAETEKKIQELLRERNQVLGLNETITEKVSEVKAETPEFLRIGTPEIYFGYKFSRNQMGNAEGWDPGGIVNYSLPETLAEDKFYLEGRWKNNEDNMGLMSEEGAIALNYNAKIINLVAGSKEPKTAIVIIDGKEIGKIEISNFDLYKLYETTDYSKHKLELKLPKGVMAYTFTFG